MGRDDFKLFVEKTVEEVLQLAEEYSGKSLSRQVAFQWLGQPLTREEIVEEIVRRVFLDEDRIYPCVDIGVGDLLDDGTPVIVATVAGYAPRPWGQNWMAKEGPFIHVIGAPFLAKVRGEPLKHSPAFSFIIPGMKDLRPL